MSGYAAQFDEPDGWETVAEGVHVKRLTLGSETVRLVEMLDLARHPEWCKVGRRGSVVEGALEVEFEDGVARFEAGEGIVIPPGRAHRPRAISARDRLALVDLPG